MILILAAWKNAVLNDIALRVARNFVLHEKVTALGSLNTPPELEKLGIWVWS